MLSFHTGELELLMSLDSIYCSSIPNTTKLDTCFEFRKKSLPSMRFTVRIDPSMIPYFVVLSSIYPDHSSPYLGLCDFVLDLVTLACVISHDFDILCDLGL